jgi:hypothetical protein
MSLIKKHSFAHRYIQLFILSIAVLSCGCASTPRWVHNSSDNTYFHTGVGSGSDFNKAEVNALLDLSAQIHGTEVDAVVEHFRREYGPASATEMDEDFVQRVKQYTSGRIPSEVRIAERWKDGHTHWAYAVVERNGQVRTIDRLFNERTSNIKAKAFVPGWAQFQKRQPRRAWTYMAGVTVGLVGGAAFAVLSNDAQDRRNQSNLQVDYTYYDDLANQRFWASNGFYLLAVSTYVANLLDAWYVDVQPYQILTNRSPTSPQGLQLSFHF